MRFVRLAAVAIMGAIAVTDALAAESFAAWTLLSRDGSTQDVEGFTMSLGSAGTMSTSWIGPMYPAEGELATLEGLESMGTYYRYEDRIRIFNDDPGDAWFWDWKIIDCQLLETPTDLTLLDCVGRVAIWPHRSEPPPNMTFASKAY